MRRKALQYLALSFTGCALAACSATPTKTPEPLPTKTTQGRMIIPSMQLKPINSAPNLKQHTADKDKQISTIYSGKALPSLKGSKIFTQYLDGLIYISQTFNGINLKKPLAQTPFKITYFATDTDGELYIGTQTGKLYKLTP